MNKNNRLAINNKVEIINKNSPYFSEKGAVKSITTQPLQMINQNSKVTNSITITYVLVKLDKIETPQKFSPDEVRKLS